MKRRNSNYDLLELTQEYEDIAADEDKNEGLPSPITKIDIEDDDDHDKFLIPPRMKR